MKPSQQKTPPFSSVNPQEVKHFSKFASTWWDEKGPYALLHRINPLRLAFAKEKIEAHLESNLEKATFRPLQNLRILDVGCGGGLLAEPLCRMGASVTGLDAVPENIEIAKKHALEKGLEIQYHPLPLEQFPLPDPLFDVITAFEILEHVENPAMLLQLCETFLRPGGVLLLSTLNRTFLSYALGIIAAEKLLKWVPSGTHQWEKFITPYELSWLLEKNGFQGVTFSGIAFHLFTQTWRLSQKCDINYLACAVKRAT